MSACHRIKSVIRVPSKGDAVKPRSGFSPVGGFVDRHLSLAKPCFSVGASEFNLACGLSTFELLARLFWRQFRADLRVHGAILKIDIAAYGAKADLHVRVSAMGGSRHCSLVQTRALVPAMKRSPGHYREEAERCRKAAESASDPDVKANLLDVARQYADLARAAEQR